MSVRLRRVIVAFLQRVEIKMKIKTRFEGLEQSAAENVRIHLI